MSQFQACIQTRIETRALNRTGKIKQTVELPFLRACQLFSGFPEASKRSTGRRSPQRPEGHLFKTGCVFPSL